MSTWFLLGLGLAGSSTPPLPVATYVPQCEIRYAWNTGVTSLDETTLTLQPNSDVSVGRTELNRVRNIAGRPVEVEVTIPTGGSKWVRLEGQGSIDPPMGSYIGNVTLKAVRCPTLYPTASMMVDDPSGVFSQIGERLQATASEFSLGPREVARIAAPQVGSAPSASEALVDALMELSGQQGDPEVFEGLREGGWTDSRVSVAIGVYGVPRTGGALQPVQWARGLDISVQDVLLAMDEWDGPYWSSAGGASTRALLEGGYAMGNVARALRSAGGLSEGQIFSTLASLAAEALGFPHPGPVIQVMQQEFGTAPQELFAMHAQYAYAGLGGLGWSLAARCEAASGLLSIADVEFRLRPLLDEAEMIHCLGAAGASAQELAGFVESASVLPIGSPQPDWLTTNTRIAGYPAEDAVVILSPLLDMYPYWQSDRDVRTLRALLDGGYALAPSVVAAVQATSLEPPDVVSEVGTRERPEALVRALDGAYRRAEPVDLVRWIAPLSRTPEDAVRTVASALRLSPAEAEQLLQELTRRR